MWLVQYERGGLDLATARLRDTLPRLRVLAGVELFANVTDLYGQMSVAAGSRERAREMTKFFRPGLCGFEKSDPRTSMQAEKITVILESRDLARKCCHCHIL